MARTPEFSRKEVPSKFMMALDVLVHLFFVESSKMLLSFVLRKSGCTLELCLCDVFELSFDLNLLKFEVRLTL